MDDNYEECMEQNMDVNCGEWMDSMSMVRRRRVWVISMGVASGCACKKVYRIPHITYLFLLLLCLFLGSSIPSFCSLFKKFIILFCYFCAIFN